MSPGKWELVSHLLRCCYRVSLLSIDGQDVRFPRFPVEEVGGVSRRRRRNLGGILGKRDSGERATVVRGSYAREITCYNLSNVLSRAPAAFRQPFWQCGGRSSPLPLSIASSRRPVTSEAEGQNRYRASTAAGSEEVTGVSRKRRRNLGGILDKGIQASG
jgi:hypothetical protein